MKCLIIALKKVFLILNVSFFFQIKNSFADSACVLSTLAIKDQALNLNGVLIDGITAETNPFKLACTDLSILKSQRSFPVIRASDVRPFFKKIITRIQSSLIGAQTQVNQISQCLNELSSTKRSCENKQVQYFLGAELPSAVQAARRNLAVGMTENPNNSVWPAPVQKLLYGNKKIVTPNYSLNTLGLYKVEPWGRLTPQEIAQANADLEQLSGNARQKISFVTEKDLLQTENQKKFLSEKDLKNSNSYSVSALKDKLYDHEMAAGRHQAFLNYMMIQSRYPILQYLNSDNPTINEVAKANNQLKNNLNKEISFINQIESTLNQLDDKDTVPQSVLQILNYSSVAEEELLQNPKNCLLAQKLMYSKKVLDSDLQWSLGFPMLVASLYSGPVGFSLLGAGIVQSELEFQNTLQQKLNLPKNNDQYMAEVFKNRERTTKYNDPLTQERSQVDLNNMASALSVVSGYGTTKLTLKIMESAKAATGQIPFYWALRQKQILPTKSFFSQ